MSVGLFAAVAAPTAAGFLSSLGITMLPVQAGTFQMGDASFSNTPLYRVTLSRGFQMSETVVPNSAMDAYIKDRGEDTHGAVVYDAYGRGYVTAVGPQGDKQRRFLFPQDHQGASDLAEKEMVELVPSANRYKILRGADIFAKPNRPAVRVSWFHALGFIAWLSQKTQIPFGLPTEVQWEYAMRAGRGQDFPYATRDGRSLEGVHWSGVVRQQTTAVVDREGVVRNPWGFKDGTGNVWEWTASWYGDYPTSSVTDPLGPPKGARRAIRGGSWLDVSDFDMRVGVRNDDDPVNRGNGIGFRLFAPQDSIG